ncbi:MAG: helix-turn-helix domain-containing protein [Bacteroidota bacterium]
MSEDEQIAITKVGILRRIIREEVRAATRNEAKENEFAERMTRKEAARFLGLQYNTMYHWIKKGIIKEHGRGRKKYFIKQELIQAMESNNPSNNK